MRVLKYALPNPIVLGEFGLFMPKGAKVLPGVHFDVDCTTFYAVVDDTNGMCERRFLSVWTGQNLVDYATAHSYVGTWRHRSNGLVYHLFDKGEER